MVYWESGIIFERGIDYIEIFSNPTDRRVWITAFNDRVLIV
jgi:hypothetical protein